MDPNLSKETGKILRFLCRDMQYYFLPWQSKFYVYFSIGFLPKQKFSILNLFLVVSKKFLFWWIISFYPYVRLIPTKKSFISAFYELMLSWTNDFSSNCCKFLAKTFFPKIELLKLSSEEPFLPSFCSLRPVQLTQNHFVSFITDDFII